MAETIVKIMGQDIFALGYVLKYPSIQEKKSFKKDKLINNTYNIEVQNKDNIFSVDNPVSMFYGQYWLYESILITGRSGETIWDGVITNIGRTHANKKAGIQSKNSLFKYRNEIIEYESDDWETGADAFKNVCDNIGFANYDDASVTASINALTGNDCLLKVNINKSDNLTFQSFIEKIAEYSNADAYSHNNQIYFVHWTPTTGGSVFTIEESDIKTLPTVSSDEANIINDYKVGYFEDLDDPATDSNGDNLGELSRNIYSTKSLPEMNSNTGQIIYQDKTSAQYIGQGYIKRTMKDFDGQPQPLTKITFSIFSDYKQQMNLQTRFKLTLSEEAWENKLFEIFEFSVDEDKDAIKIVAYEVAS